MTTLESGASDKASSTASAPTTPPGIPAPYGRACANCVKAKCKCFYRGRGRELTSCERCHRLGKECVPSETIRKRTARRQTASRTAQLEEKLDDLVSLLKTHRRQPGVGSAASSELATQGPPPASEDFQHAQAPQAQPQSQPLPLTPPTLTPTVNTPNYQKPSFSNKSSCEATAESAGSPNPITRDPTLQLDLEAEECLQLFSKRFLYYFPFFHVKEHMTVHQMQHEYPVFMLAIKSVACKVFSRQLEYSEQLQRIFAQKAVIEYENSIDILLALITAIGWIHFHEPRRPFLTLMTRLATSQAIELGLHRPFGETYGIIAFRNADALPKKEPGRKPTNEQRRAALGCYFATSSVFTSLKRAEGLAWTPYLEEMLLDLIKESDWPRDAVLVAHVKLQQVQEQLYKARIQPGIQPGDSAAISDSPKALPQYYTNLLRRTVRDVRSSLPAEIASDVPVEFFQRYVEFTIAESALDYKEAPFSNPAATSTNQQNTTSISLKQLETINDLVDALERFFNCFYEIPPIHFIGMAYSFAGVIPHAMWTLFKLCTTHTDSVWNPSEVRCRMDLLYILDLLREKLLHVPDLVGLVPNVTASEAADPKTAAVVNIFTRCGPILDSLRMGWAAELQKYTLSPSAQDCTPSTTFSGTTIPVTQQGPIAAQINMAPGFGPQGQQQELMPMYMPQYDVSSWLSFPPIDHGWFPMDMSYN